LVSAEERSFYWQLTSRENLRFYASLDHEGQEFSSSLVADVKFIPLSNLLLTANKHIKRII